VVRCNTPTTMHCNTLQRTATHVAPDGRCSTPTAMRCNTLQRAAAYMAPDMRCSTLLPTNMCCNKHTSFLSAGHDGFNRQKFSKVSSLLHITCKVTYESDFWRHTNQHTLTLSFTNIRTHTRTHILVAQRGTGGRQQAEILQNMLATKYNM